MNYLLGYEKLHVTDSINRRNLMDTQKYRDVRIAEELVLEIEEAREEGYDTVRQSVPTNCTSVIHFPPDGGPATIGGCAGGCGFIDRFLGRACQIVTQKSPDSVLTFCDCNGGWWDRIFK